MAKERKTRTNLYVPHGLKPKLKYLTAEEKGVLFEALLDYSISGETAEFEDRYMQALFEEYAGIEKQNAEAYEETCRRNRENGQNGGRPSEEPTETQSNPKEPKVTDNNPSEPKKPDKDKDRDKDLYIGGIYARASKPPEWEEKALSGLKDESVKEKIREWLAYKREKYECPTPLEVKSLVKELNENVKKHGSKAVADLIARCMGSGYKGITWSELERNKGRPYNGKNKPSFAQREFDEQAEKEKRVRGMMKEAERLNAQKEGSG